MGVPAFLESSNNIAHMDINISHKVKLILLETKQEQVFQCACKHDTTYSCIPENLPC